MTDAFSVEQNGQIVIARVRGTPTEELLAEIHRSVLALLKRDSFEEFSTTRARCFRRPSKCRCRSGS